MLMLTLEYLVLQSTLPLEEILDSEAQRRLGSSGLLGLGSLSCSTTKPLTKPGGDKKKVIS